MLSFTKPTSDQDGEETAPAAETTPPEVSPLFAEAKETPTPTPVEAAYDPAVRSQIQRVRLDLLSRETERLEQQLRQVLEQQNEDRQLREELRGQIAGLNRRLESLLAGGAAKAAESGGTDGDLRTAVKPLLQAVMQMLDSTEPADPAEPATSAESSEAWEQIDAARRGPAPMTASPSTVEPPAEPTQEAATAPEADTTDSGDHADEPDGLDAPEPDLPEAGTAPAMAADPEDDLDLDPEAELRVEIARLLRPKKPGGGYGPLGQPARPAAERAQAETAPAPSPPAPSPPAPTEEPEPLLLGTDETPEVNDASPPESRVMDAGPARAADAAPALGQGEGAGEAADGSDDPSDEPGAAQGDLRGGGAVSRNQRPSWAPRPNPMRASLPKCLTEPWEEEQSRRPSGRWPFRRTRPAGRRDEPTE